MSLLPLPRFARWGSALGLVALAAACSEPADPTTPAAVDAEPQFSDHWTGAPQSITLCKVGEPGTWAEFHISATGGTLLEGETIRLDAIDNADAPEGCAEIWQATFPKLDPDPVVEVTVEEVDQTEGTELTKIFAFSELDGETNIWDPASPSITVHVDFDHGAFLKFTNEGTPPPPPPGDEGCTPGYWKQAHHFDSWTGYAPTDLFQDVFGTGAFPGMTLLDVLELRGGKIKALGRHTVAALLSASSADVAYPLTTDDVISSFQAAWMSGDFETLKDRFEGYNEQFCPLD